MPPSVLANVLDSALQFSLLNVSPSNGQGEITAQIQQGIPDILSRMAPLVNE